MTMNTGATAATAGSTAAAVIAQAIKASGAIVRVRPEDFLAVLARTREPVVVMAHGGFFSSRYKYLTSYKGLAFFTKSKEPVQIPGSAEVIEAEKIWVPD